MSIVQFCDIAKSEGNTGLFGSQTVITAIGFSIVEAVGDLGKKKRQQKDRCRRSFGAILKENGS